MWIGVFVAITTMYMYRDDKVELLSLYQEEDIEDVFEREPFCAFFRSREIGENKKMVLPVFTQATYF